MTTPEKLDSIGPFLYHFDTVLDDFSFPPLPNLSSSKKWRWPPRVLSCVMPDLSTWVLSHYLLVIATQTHGSWTHTDRLAKDGRFKVSILSKCSLMNCTHITADGSPNALVNHTPGQRNVVKSPTYSQHLSSLSSITGHSGDTGSSMPVLLPATSFVTIWYTVAIHLYRYCLSSAITREAECHSRSKFSRPTNDTAFWLRNSTSGRKALRTLAS